MYHFCTYFDKNYLARGLTLYRSLVKHCRDFRFYVLCLDDITHSVMSRLPLDNLVPISLHQVELWDKRLLVAKNNRRLIEYYFTLSPILPLFLLDQFPNMDKIAYLDADLYFYSDPKPIFDALGDHSILTIEHKFSEHLKHLEVYGRFNVQCQIFRKDDQGRKCLEMWRDQCLEWCYDRMEDGKFADQKYLDEWPNMYDRLVILEHKGAGLAPWNWSQYRIEVHGDQASIDKQTLIFYHFHGLQILNRCVIIDGTNTYGRMTKEYILWFYAGYMREMKITERWLADAHGIQQLGLSYSDSRFCKNKWMVFLKGWYRGKLTWIC